MHRRLPRSLPIRDTLVGALRGGPCLETLRTEQATLDDATQFVGSELELGFAEILEDGIAERIGVVLAKAGELEELLPAEGKWPAEA